ncbi:MAG TPA: hypothetical protein VG826_27905 [Pirellulales bacterium]|nr:hypothetical protein [Pirellulales bacterium]
MRILAVLATFVSLLAGGQAAQGQFIGCPGPLPHGAVQLAGGRAAQGQWSDEKLYVVECRIVTTTTEGKEESQLGPSLTVAEGRTAVINDITQTPIVASVVRRRGGEEPRITVLKEGTTVELVVHDEGDGWVTLDAEIETSKITGLKEKEAGNGRRRQCARLEGHRVRVMELTSLGEEFSVPLHGAVRADGKAGEAKDRRIEFTIHTPDMPRHWYSESEMRAAARRKSWLWQMWLVVLRTMAAV